MNKDANIFLNHIIESARYINERLVNVDQEKFNNDVALQDSIIRRLEIIGEAIRHVPDDVKTKYKNVPWVDVMDARNKLIHDYFGVDLKLVWEMAKNDVPALEKQIEEILELEVA